MENKDNVKLGPYRLLYRLARGGMSEIYVVSDERDEQVYALKMVKQRDDEDCLRFQQEIQALMHLKHPHILPILDTGSQEDVCYYVMPYIAHGTIKDRLERGPLSEEEAQIVLNQVADALHFLHASGLVHRDVKPSNILQDETNHVWLADFGLVRTIEGGSDLTKTGYLVGTPAYMAPELENMQPSANSDIYALGVVLYEMLAGHVPFVGRTPLDIYWKQVYEQPPFPSTINPFISPAVEQVVLRALEKDPSDRYPSAQALAKAYQEALRIEHEHPVSIVNASWGSRENDALAMPPIVTSASHNQTRGRRMPLAIGALAVMALLTLSLVSMSAVSHGRISLLSTSPAQALAVAPGELSPTHTSTSAQKATPTLPAGPSGGTSPSGTITTPPESSATPGITPPAGAPTTSPNPAGPPASTPPAATPTPEGPPVSTPPAATATPTPAPSVVPTPSTTPVSTPTPAGKTKKKQHK